MQPIDLFVNNYQNSILESGIRLHFIKTKVKKSCFIKIIIRCAPFLENSQNKGISHLVEHMIFQGNKKLGNRFHLNRILESLPGDINAATSFEQTEFWYSFPVYASRAAIKNFCYLLFYPEFSNFEKEKSVICEEIKVDFNEKMQPNNLLNIANDILWQEQPPSFPTCGTIESINKLNEQELKTYYKRHYHPENMIIGVVGDLEIDNLVETFNHYIPQFNESYKKPQIPPCSLAKNHSPHIKWINHQSSQIEFLWSFPIEELSDRQILLLDLLSHLMDDGSSSTFFRKIREDKGLVYEISTSIFQYQKSAIFYIQTRVSGDRLLEFSRVLSKEIKRIINKGFMHWELLMHKKRRQGEIYCLSDFPQEYLEQMIEDSLYPNRTLAQYRELLDAVTLDDVNKLAIKLFDNQKSLLLLSALEQDKAKFSEKLQNIYSHWLN